MERYNKEYQNWDSAVRAVQTIGLSGIPLRLFL